MQFAYALPVLAEFDFESFDFEPFDFDMFEFVNLVRERFFVVLRDVSGLCKVREGDMLLKFLFSRLPIFNPTVSGSSVPSVLKY